MLLNYIESHNMFSAYSSSSSSTEFGRIIWDIIRFPNIPLNVSDLHNPVHDRATKNSLLSQSEYEIVRSRWVQEIQSLRDSGDNGFSLRRFMTMVADLFGIDSETEHESKWPVSTSSIHRLIITGDSSYTNCPRTLNKAVLAFISQFSTHNFDALVQLGENTVIAFKVNLQKQKLETKPTQLDLALSDSTKSIVFLNKDASPVPTSAKANSLRTIVHQYLLENGYRDLISVGVRPDELLEILFEPNPKLSVDTLRYILKYVKIDAHVLLDLFLNDDV